MKRGLIASDLRNSVDRECGCKKNQWKSVPESELEDFMFAISQLSKKEHEQVLLGEVSSCLKRSTTGKERPLFFKYRIRGAEVCKSVFMDVNGVGSHVMRTMLEKAERGEVQQSEHALRGHAPLHLSLMS